MSLFDDPDVGATPEPTWSVRDLADAIGGVLRSAFPAEVWVHGEIHDLSRPRSGHVYFTLVDPDALDGGACLAVMLSATKKGAVNRALTRAGGGVRMTDGTDVRIRGRIDWYSPRGQLQLRMSGIDPAYTLGQLEVARAELLAKLAVEGLVAANAARPLPLVPLRVGLVTSGGSAAEADFTDELRRSGYAFRVVLQDSLVQGIDAPPRLAAAIARLAARDVDLIAVVRGGGARTDLAAFDHEVVARAIATCPVPVFTGIGHETDRSVADEVAHRSEKTPTACAQAIVATVAAYDGMLTGAWSAIAHRALRHIGHHEAHLDDVAQRAGRGATAGLRTAARRLDGHRGRVHGAARAHLRAADLVVGDAGRRLRTRAPRALVDAERALASVEARVRANDPARTLARGWSITRTADGQVVRSPDSLSPGDELRTQVAGGELRSTVIDDA